MRRCVAQSHSRTAETVPLVRNRIQIARLGAEGEGPFCKKIKKRGAGVLLVPEKNPEPPLARSKETITRAIPRCLAN